MPVNDGSVPGGRFTYNKSCVDEAPAGASSWSRVLITAQPMSPADASVRRTAASLRIPSSIARAQGSLVVHVPSAPVRRSLLPQRDLDSPVIPQGEPVGLDGRAWISGCSTGWRIERPGLALTPRRASR